MIHKKVYKIYAINDSFNYTLERLCNFLESEYDIENLIKSDSICLPDNIKVGHPPYDPWHKPEKVFVTLNFCSEKSWTNEGGYEYCQFILKDKSKILIRWDVRSNKKEFEEFSNKTIRKLKLDKLDLIYRTL